MHDLQTIVQMNAIASEPKPRQKLKADLKNWMLTGRVGSDSENPNSGFMLAYGLIYNDEAKRFPDGMEIRSSTIISVDTKKMQVETLNTIYNLK